MSYYCLKICCIRVYFKVVGANALIKDLTQIRKDIEQYILVFGLFSQGHLFSFGVWLCWICFISSISSKSKIFSLSDFE